MRCVLTLVAVLLVVPASAGAAAKRPPTPVPAGIDAVVQTAHFVVHYTTAAGPSATTAEHAQELADAGERGYAAAVGQYGFPPPLDDGDGKTDIYVYDGGEAFARADVKGEQSTGYITYSPTAHPIHIPHEFFHLVQYGMYTGERGWMNESTADWAAIGTAGGYTAKPFAFRHPEVPLDCTGAAETDCGGDRYGYHAAVFWFSLSERFGPAVVREVYERAAALGAGNGLSHGLQALGEVLAAHGTSLEQAFGDYAIANQTGAYKLPGLAKERPDPDSDRAVGAKAADFSVAVDHLAAKYVVLVPRVGRCAGATLQLTVTAPAGGTAAYVAADGTATRLTSGTPDGVAIGGCDTGTLVLANGALSGDAAPFAVQARIDQAAAPVPKLTLERGKLAGRKLRVKFSSTAGGSFRATLGQSTRNGTLRKGTNRVAIKLPRAGGTVKLRITPYSSTGERGTPVTRTVKVG
jgi:hypothetical protein